MIARMLLPLTLGLACLTSTITLAVVSGPGYPSVVRLAAWLAAGFTLALWARLAPRDFH